VLIRGRFLSLRMGLILAAGALALAVYAQDRTPRSGIYGTMVAAWGNAPANPPTYKCVRVFDSAGRRLVATGVCSGIFGAFRIPLAPGRYLVDKRPVASSEPAAPGPRSFVVEVKPGKWLRLAPRAPAGRVP
jgi:hypothetical protein